MRLALTPALSPQEKGRGHIIKCDGTFAASDHATCAAGRLIQFDDSSRSLSRGLIIAHIISSVSGRDTVATLP